MDNESNESNETTIIKVAIDADSALRWMTSTLMAKPLLKRDVSQGSLARAYAREKGLSPRDPALLALASRALSQVPTLRSTISDLVVRRVHGDLQAGIELERIFDAGLRHKNDTKPRDYLEHWLRVTRAAFGGPTTRDDSWGELEKRLAPIFKQALVGRLRQEKMQALLTLDGEPEFEPTKPLPGRFVYDHEDLDNDEAWA